MSKIQEAASIKYKIANCKEAIQNGLGNTYSKSNGYIRDSSIDKYNCKFDIHSHHSSPPLYFDCYHGYYGDSNVSMITDDFYMQCLCEAVNKHMKEIREDTEKIMQDKYIKALSEAKTEAEQVISEYDKLIGIEETLKEINK